MAGEATLYGRMELRLTDAEKRLAKFQGTLDKSMGTMERRTAKAAATMQTSLSNSAMAFSGKIAAGVAASAAAMLSFTAVLNGTKAALNQFGDIADKSAQSGLDAEFFQSLKYQASLAGVGMDELSGALSTFNKNSGLAVVNKGKMVSALKVLNPELLANIQNAKSQEERIRLVAEAIDREADASRKAAIASAAFGDAGTRLVAVFKGGVAVIDETAAKARELGIIVNRDLIASADELGDQFDTATQVIDAQFKQALVNLAPVLVSTAGFLAKVAGGIALVVDYMRDLDNKSLRGLELSQATNALERLDIENKILALKSQEQQGGLSLMDQAELADLQARRDALKATDEQITNIIGKRNEERAASKEASAAVAELNDALENNNSSTNTAIKGIDSYAEAIRALKEEIPALSQQLAKLDAESKIDAVYKQAVQKATTIGEVYQANQLRNEAMQAVNIKSATSDSGKYLQQYLAADKTMQSLSGMQQQFSTNLAEMLASAPKDIQSATQIFSGYRSIERQQELWNEALQKYGSVEEARKWVAPPGNSQHNMGNAADLRFSSDAARQWFHDNAAKYGLSFPLSNEPWHIEDASARSSSIAEASTKAVASSENFEKSIADQQRMLQQLKEETGLRASLNPLIDDHGQKLTELQKAQELFNMAQQEGTAAGKELTSATQLLTGDLTSLTPEAQKQAEAMRALAQQYGLTTAAANQLQASQEAASKSSTESLELAKSVTGGILSDIRSALSDGKITWKEWGEIAVNALNKVADKLQEMLLNQLFSPTGGLGSLFGGLGGSSFNLATATPGLFSDGGFTGSGGKYDPAGIVHKGEYVFDQDSVKRLGLENLRALHRGYFNGGLVGDLSRPGSLSRAGRGGAGGLDIAVAIRKDGLNLEPEVVAVTRREGQAGLNLYRRNQLHQDIDSHAKRPRRVGSI